MVFRYRRAQGREGKARAALLKTIDRLTAQLSTYLHFLDDDAQGFQHAALIAAWLPKLHEHLDKKSRRAPGWVPPGLAKFLEDVIGHPEGFTEEATAEATARLVAAACGVTTGPKPAPVR